MNGFIVQGGAPFQEASGDHSHFMHEKRGGVSPESKFAMFATPELHITRTGFAGILFKIDANCIGQSLASTGQSAGPFCHRHKQEVLRWSFGFACPVRQNGFGKLWDSATSKHASSAPWV